MTKPSLARYRTTNLLGYNAALRKRGSLLIWPDREMTWLAPHDGRPASSVDSTTGPIHLRDWIGDSWVFFFSHPRRSAGTPR